MLTLAPGTSSASTQAIIQGGEQPRFAHLPFLDGLRGLAIIMVMQFHSQGQISRLCSGRGGWWGVEIFFVLSGFLITSIILDEQKHTKNINLRNFYTRRLIRLVPALAAYLGLILFMNPFVSPNPAVAVLIAVAYLSDFDLALHLGHIANSGLDITWSLGIEEKYYAVWPLMAKHVRNWLPTIAVSTIIMCIAWRGFLILHGATWIRMHALDTHVDGIMLGSLMSTLLCKHRARRLLIKILGHRNLSIALFVLTLCLCRIIGRPDKIVDCSQNLLFFCLILPGMSLLFAVLIVSLYLTDDSVVKRIMSWRPLTWVGDISYSLYLWHSFAFLIIVGRIVGLPAEIAGWCLAFCFAGLSYYCIERPCSRLRRFFRVADRPISEGFCEQPITSCKGSG
jgi:peptidoglycan/LPS O-acetylase OafA/YrhL